MSDKHKLDAVEQLIPIAAEAGLSLTHMAMAFVMAHPSVTSAIIGPRTLEHLDDMLASVEARLGDDILNKIDEVVPPGTDVGQDEAKYNPPSITRAELRRRPLPERSAS